MKIEDAFDHPCRETCSGWSQGRARGVAEELQKARDMLDEVYRAWIKHNHTKFTTDGSHLQADIELSNVIQKHRDRIGMP